MPMMITNDRRSVRSILRIVDACIIPHNLLVDIGEDDIPREWKEEVDDASEIGAAVGEHGMSAPLLDGQMDSDERRKRCMDYMCGQGILL